MDWSRAKSVLIFAFLLLNLVLGYQLWLDVREQWNSNLDWTSLPEETKAVMEQKRIQVPAKIPSDTPVMREVTVRFVDPEPFGKTVKLEEPVDSKVIFTEKELRKALEDQIPGIENYNYDPLIASDEAFVMNLLLDRKWPMFEVQMELFYANQKIVAYRESHVEMLVSEDDKAQKVLPATTALGRLIEKYLPPGAIVKDIQLGYHGQVYNETLVTAPSWRIMLENGDIYFVNAISAEVYHPQS